MLAVLTVQLVGGLSRTHLSVLTTFPIVYTICMRSHRIIRGNVVIGVCAGKRVGYLARRDTRSIYLTPYTLYGVTIQVKLSGLGCL